MILSRLTKAIREQNWFAVVLEFFIVVIGVAVGFQLTQRYDQAQVAAREAEYLQGIATDYTIYQNIIICRIDVEAEIRRGLVHLLDAVDGAELSEREYERALFAITMSQVSQPGLPLEGNTSALVAGDLIESISDDQLRGLILAAQSISTSTVTSMSQIHDFLLVMPRIDGFTERTLSEENGFFVASGVDFEAMRAQPGIRNTLIDLHNLHRSSQANDERQKDAIDNVLARLEALGVREAPAEDPSCWGGPLPTADAQ
ncbi:hypothetical protein [Maricaulis sp.]|uniref:hypothetical protein n=1 Tax=Maricaulis sp. TaxID=1486257 RepID=UPI0026030D47|nr:hypothetical protein [Maricaulis sp.]